MYLQARLGLSKMAAMLSYDPTANAASVYIRHRYTLAVFEIVPYSLTHYSLYRVNDIVNYIGNEQTRIWTLG